MEIICPQCGFARKLAHDKIPAGKVVAKCPRCHCRFRFSAESGAGEILPPKAWQMPNEKDPEEEDIRQTAKAAYEREAKRFADGEKEEDEREDAGEEMRNPAVNPWELAPEKVGWVEAFYQTVIRVMFQAPAFFKNLSPKAEMLRPLFFFLVVGLFQTLLEQVWSKVFFRVLAPEAANDGQLARLLEILSSSNGFLHVTLLRMGSLVLQLYAFTLLMYLAYRVVARERASFSLVMQVLAYSTAPWLLCVVPGVGSLAGAIWGMGCVAVGCKSAMELNWGQTLVGFLPIIFVLMPLVMQLLSLK